MPTKTRIVAPGPHDRTVVADDGSVLTAPDDWELLPPGDAGWTRRVKAGGPSWTVKEKRGRRTFSRGVWAPAQRIAAVKVELDAERSTESYARRQQKASERRAAEQTTYVDDFHSAVVQFLNFHDRYSAIAHQLAVAVTTHATPVGSGTVARTKRIPIEKRAAAAVIAWMRHQTTAYDNMKIARVKGRRREVRRMLAEQSQRLLRDYRRGSEVDAAGCPLQQAIKQLDDANLRYTADAS